jgi:hypothetical protein
MYPFSADALSICQLTMLWKQYFQRHVVREHFVRFAQVDMLHVMRGDGVTDRANG